VAQLKEGRVIMSVVTIANLSLPSIHHQQAPEVRPASLAPAMTSANHPGVPTQGQSIH